MDSNPVPQVSCTSFSKLARTAISDLLMNAPSKGCYLALHTITPAKQNLGIQTTVEDEFGNVATFYVHNYSDSYLGINPENFLPLGTAFILKEPFIKPGTNKEKIIQCDSPTDIIVIERCNKLFPLLPNISWSSHICDEITDRALSTSDELKDLGNDLFSRNMLRKANEAYFIALEIANPEDVTMRSVLYSNIAATFLKMGNFESTLTYTEKVLLIDPNSTKAMYRSGRAHYELRNYRDARENFESVLKLEPENKEASKELEKCASRMKEAKGNIDMYRLYLTSALKPKSTIDVADYTGPLNITQRPGKGRGVVATTDIVPGTILSVSKAIQVSYADDKPSTVTEKGAGYNEHVALLEKVIPLVHKNPNTFGKMVYGLTSNDENLDKNGRLFCNPHTKEEPIVDAERIRKILKTNCYSVDATSISERISSFGSAKTLNSGSGLFILPSYMNHNCLFNASWHTYNNVMVTIAVKPIQCGEEVFLSYFNNLKPYFERSRSCSKRGFQCLCLLCELDRAEDKLVHVERLNAYKKIEYLSSKVSGGSEYKSNDVLAEMSGLIDKIEDTYKNGRRSTLKTYLLIPYMKYSLVFMRTKQLEKMKKTIDNALQAIGLSYQSLLRFSQQNEPFSKKALITPMIFYIAVMLICGYAGVGRIQEAKRWLGVLISLEKVYTGGNIQMVKAKYKNIPTQLF